MRGSQSLSPLVRSVHIYERIYQAELPLFSSRVIETGPVVIPHEWRCLKKEKVEKLSFAVEVSKGQMFLYR